MPVERTTALIPFRGGCPYREAALRWVSARYAALGVDVVVAEPADGPWRKGEAIRRGLERVATELVVVADADCWSDGVDAAIAAVDGGAGWARPHRRVHRLTERETARVLGGTRPSVAMRTVMRPYRGVASGGILVARADTLRDVPPDPRFAGWGGEDVAWRAALRCLVGPEWAGRAPLFHLWHPPQIEGVRRRPSPENRALAERYSAALEDPEAMRALIGEAA